MTTLTRAEIGVLLAHAKLARYDEACAVTDPAAIMIQEVIPGLGAAQLSYAALAESGEVLCSLVAQRTRQYPGRLSSGRVAGSAFVTRHRDDAVSRCRSKQAVDGAQMRAV